MQVKIFVKDNCPKCPKAKELGKALEAKSVNVKYHNIGEVDGLSESIFYDVLGTPSVVITDDAGKEITSFRADVPGLDDVVKHLD